MSNFTLSSLKNTVDELRSQYYPKNETEKKVYEALSSKNWGASSTLLNDIAAESMDYDKYKIMTKIIWEFLETDGRTWKQIFKDLTLIEFLIKNGSERFIEECRDKMYKIRGLQDFNFYEGTIEKASGIREKARQIVELLGSNEMIRSERDKARQLRNKFVGIDSRNSGYGGSDSYYGGGGGGGGGRDYGGSRDRDYGGNGDRDYGGSGSGGGRYSDSYDAPHGRRSSTGSDNNNRAGRYGGGAYDSDRPPRYGDDNNEDRQSFRDESHDSRPNVNRYADTEATEEPVTKTTPHKSRSIAGPTSNTSTTATGGKLKVNIKKPNEPSHTKHTTTEKNLLETSEVDLIGGPVSTGSNSFDAFTSAPANAGFDPFGNNPAPTSHANNAAAFDPFGSAPAPAQPRNNNAAAFDPFGMSAPVAPAAPAQPAFDPFAAAPSVMPTPQANAFPFNNAPVAPVQAFPPANNYQNNFPPSNPQAFPANNAFPSSVPLAPTPAIQTNQYIQPNPAPVQSPSNKFGTFSHDAEFGDFEGPAQVQNNSSKANNNAAEKWGDLGKLVDLNKIEKNAAQQAKQTSSNNNPNYHSSFAGLDGFSKTPQNMNASSAVRPIGSYGNAPMNAPMNAMGAPRPMGTGLTPNYGQPMGMGMNPAMGNPGMGAPYGAAPMGAPMGQPNYGGNFGGYPNAGGFPGAAPTGNPGFGGVPPNPNYMMGNQGMYNAPPNAGYGNTQGGFGGPPRGW